MNIRRDRNAKIVATRGPATNDRDTVIALFHAGVDVFRLDFGHDIQQGHAARVGIIRELEREAAGQPASCWTCRGPKLRIGTFGGGPVHRQACSAAKAQGFGQAGQTIVIPAGMPFGTPGTTNVMSIAQIQ